MTSAWRPEPGGPAPVVEAMGELARDLQREHADRPRLVDAIRVELRDIADQLAVSGEFHRP